MIDLNDINDYLQELLDAIEKEDSIEAERLARYLYKKLDDKLFICLKESMPQEELKKFVCLIVKNMNDGVVVKI